MSDRPETECITIDAPPPGDGMRWIPGGTFRMGDDNAYLEEAPAHAVAVSSFWIDAYVVTNANFAAFVTATGYRTVAERPLDPAAYPGADPSLLTPGSSVFFMPTSPANLGDIRSRWAYVPRAYWRHPEGPGSTIEDREQHPVVHVAFEDAEAYAVWKKNFQQHPDMWFTHSGMARVYSSQGDFDNAVKEMKLAEAAAPEQNKVFIQTAIKRLEAKDDINK